MVSADVNPIGEQSPPRLRIGLPLAMPGEELGTRDFVRRAQTAETDDFDSVWLPQVFTTDALTVLAVVGGETANIELGTAVVPTYPRHPVALASQALTVQDAAGGRLTLGIGLSHKFVIERMLGMNYARRLTHIREYLAVLTALLTGDQVEFHGEEFNISAMVSVPQATPPPVLLAALGPAMLRTAGQLAAGTITLAAGIDDLRKTVVPTISEAGRSVGRTPRVVAMLPVAATQSPAEARLEIAHRFRAYASVPSYRRVLERSGAQGIEDTALVGRESVIAAGLSELQRIGVTDLVAATVHSSDARTRAFLAEWRRGAFKSAP